MPRNSQQTWKQVEQKLAQVLHDLPPIIGNDVVNFAIDNIKRQAWQGNSTTPWKKRKQTNSWGTKNEPNRALLVKTGKLQRSIRVSRISKGKVIVSAGGPDVPYAKAHNYGFRGKVRQNVRPFTRKMRDGSTQNVKGYNRTLRMNIPKRQFIGGLNESPYLKRKLSRSIKLAIKKKFN